MDPTFPQQLASFNRAVALDRVGGDQDLLREVALLFLEESGQTMENLRRAVADGNAFQVQSTAHTLKGAASNFGAEATCETASRLEMLGRSGNLDGAEEALRELESALNGLRTRLADLTAA
jgi:HPt (histidine-containing phosphotransfer) domain-containing protein